MIIINVAWYIEQTINRIDQMVEDCTKHEKKHYTFVNGEIKEGELLNENDWENEWSKV